MLKRTMGNYSLLIFFAISFWFVDARVISLREPRLSLAEENPSYFLRSLDGNPNTYMFGYDSDNQYRTEERYPNGTVVGSYGYIGLDGTPYRYNYIADAKGYRVMKDRRNQNNQNTNMGNMNENQSNMNKQNDMSWMENGIYQNHFQQNMNQNQQNDMNWMENGMNQNQFQQNMNQDQQNDMSWMENGIYQNQFQQQQYLMNQNNMYDQYQQNYNSQNQNQQNDNIYQQYQQNNPTEDSITWSRPKKQKSRNHSYLARTIESRAASKQNNEEPIFSYVPMLRKTLR